MSPMLSILAIDPLQIIMELASGKNILHPVLPKAAKLRCSLYANDAALFSNPDREELNRISQLLHTFRACSGLKVNLSKTEIFPIKCTDEIIAEASGNFQGTISSFPGKYLGLLLHTRKLRRFDVQPLIDKVGARLSGWKGKLLTTAGQEMLVKNVLSSQPIYHLTVFPTQNGS